MSLKLIHKYLFKLFLFLLPFQIGVAYTHLLEADLIYAFDVLLFFLYVLWMNETGGFVSRPIYWGKLTLPSLSMIFWVLICFINAISYTMAGLGLFMLVKVFLIYLYLINNIRTKPELQVAVNCVLGGMLFQGFLGFVQYTTGSSLGLEFAGAVFKGTRASGLARIRGTLGMPNQFGAWLALIFPLAISLFIFEPDRKQKLFYGLAASFGAFAVLMTFSRSAWAGIIGGSVVFLVILIYKRLLKPKYIIALAVSAIVVAGILAYFWTLIQWRMESGATGKYRMRMINIAFDMFKENPVFGVGLHNYRFHSMQYFRFWHPVHNTYLRLLAETGIVGLLFFLWTIFRAVKESFILLKARDRFIFSVALGCLCSLCAFLTAIQFGPEYQHYRVKSLFWLILGILFALRPVYGQILEQHKLRQKKSQQDPRAKPKGMPGQVPSQFRNPGMSSR